MEIKNNFGIQSIPSKINTYNYKAQNQNIDKTNTISATYKNDLSTKDTEQVQIRTYKFLQPGEISQKLELLNGSPSATKLYLLSQITDYVKGTEVRIR